MPPVFPLRDIDASLAGRRGGRAAGLPAVTAEGVTAGIPEVPGGSVPVLPALQDLVPGGGLARGSVVSVDQPGMLCAALLAGAARESLWCAVTGLPRFGVAAAAEAGARPDRLMLVPDPGAGWPEVAAILLDACDVVLLGVAGHVPARIRARLEARARAAGAVLIVAGQWDGAPLRLQVLQRQWQGIGDGYGRLAACRAEVQAQGRGLASRPRRAWLWLPGPDGAVTAAEPGERHAGDAWRTTGSG